MDRITREAIKPTVFCAYCHKPMNKVRPWSKVCSQECRLLYEKQKREEHNKYHKKGLETPYLKRRFEVLMRDNFTCQYCGITPQTGGQLQVDHIIPKARGGTDDINNLVTSCVECNLGKGDMLINRKD